MKILISPAKKMKDDIAYLEPTQLPMYLSHTQKLLQHIKTLSHKELMNMLRCNQAIASSAKTAYETMQLDQNTVPAILSYDGIQYTYMAPHIFTEQEFQYVQDHVYILSGFYGILRPLDAVVPYRLELNDPFFTSFCDNLYDFWKDLPFLGIQLQPNEPILDLASVQYSKIIIKYAKQYPIIKCLFMEQTKDGYKEKGVYVKMARGAMVRFLASTNAKTIEDVKQFKELGYQYNPNISSEHRLVFTRG